MKNCNIDNELVDQLINDDTIAFDKIFEKYSSKLYGFALRYLKSESDAEELVHNVFVKIWEKRKTIKRESSLKSFLFTITYHDILKHFRKKSFHHEFLKDSIYSENLTDNSSERIEYNSILEYVDKLIEQLPEKRKLIFIKSRKEGKTSKEIAKELNLSPGTIDNNISEALKFIKQGIKKESLAFVLFITLFL